MACVVTRWPPRWMACGHNMATQMDGLWSQQSPRWPARGHNIATQLNGLWSQYGYPDGWFLVTTAIQMAGTWPQHSHPDGWSMVTVLTPRVMVCGHSLKFSASCLMEHGDSREHPVMYKWWMAMEWAYVMPAWVLFMSSTSDVTFIQHAHWPQPICDLQDVYPMPLLRVQIRCGGLELWLVFVFVVQVTPKQTPRRFLWSGAKPITFWFKVSQASSSSLDQPKITISLLFYIIRSPYLHYSILLYTVSKKPKPLSFSQ